MVVLVEFPNGCRQEHTSRRDCPVLRPSAQEALLGVFLDCLVVKKQATTRFQGDDLIILARLRAISVKK